MAHSKVLRSLVNSVLGFLAILVVAVLPCEAQDTRLAPRFLNPASLPTPRGYSQVVEVPVSSRLVYISGQIALDSTGNVVGSGDFRTQAYKVFDNLQRGLTAVGLTFSDVVKLNFYLLDVTQVSILREVRDRYVNNAAPPTSTLVEVRRLVRDEFLLEVDAVAVAPIR